MKEITATESELLRLEEELSTQFRLFSDAEMNYDDADRFLRTSLRKISCKEECSRVTQLYWALAPLLLLQRLQERPSGLAALRAQAVCLLEDPLSLHYAGQQPHIICIYAASLLRRALGVQAAGNAHAISQHLELLFDPASGGFRATEYGECDCRTTYAGICVIYLQKIGCFAEHYSALSAYFMRKLDYGFSGADDGERHASYTFCALAGLELLRRLGFETVFSRLQKARLLKFLAFRQYQSGGFNGRINKLEDGCYNFWVGGSLALLGAQELIDYERFNDWVRICNQDFVTGGFRDKPGVSSDRFHNCYVLTGWWLLNGREGVDPCCPIFLEKE